MKRLIEASNETLSKKIKMTPFVAYVVGAFLGHCYHVEIIRLVLYQELGYQENDQNDVGIHMGVIVVDRNYVGKVQFSGNFSCLE